MPNTSPSPTGRPQPAVGYVYDNANAHASEQHRCLALAYDAFTTARLDRIGVRPGMYCLDVGAGGGGVATWLAQRVTPSGSVLATDLQPHHIRATPSLRVEAHDITTDPLPDSRFDIIHVRLLLLHLPQRLAVLAGLVRALKPGGWLQIDDFDETTYGPLLLAPEPFSAAQSLYESYIAAKLRLLKDAGVRLTWGREIPTAMREAGLTDIDAEPHVQQWKAESPGTALQVHNTWHLRARLVEAGMSDEQLHQLRTLMTSDNFLATSCIMYSVQGRRVMDS
jgi:ubiquinone/menaquinone biosynthesis C-methylase UbiE